MKYVIHVTVEWVGGFEGRLSNMWFFVVEGYLHKIKGKNGVIKHPFEGAHKLDEGRKIIIDNNGKKRIQYSTPITITPSNGDPLKTSIRYLGDADDLKSLHKLAYKKSTRYAKDKSIPFNEKKLSSALQNGIINAFRTIHDLPEQAINIDFSINISDMELLYIKIGYELAVYHFGLKYLDDTIAKKLASSLYDLKIDDALDISVIQDIGEPYKTFFEEGYHWVYFYKGLCFIKIYKIFGHFKFYEDKKNCKQQDLAFRFCYKTQTYEKIFWSGLITNAFEAGNTKGLEEFISPHGIEY